MFWSKHSYLKGRLAARLYSNRGRPPFGPLILEIWGLPGGPLVAAMYTICKDYENVGNVYVSFRSHKVIWCICKCRVKWKCIGYKLTETATRKPAYSIGLNKISCSSVVWFVISLKIELMTSPISRPYRTLHLWMSFWATASVL